MPKRVLSVGNCSSDHANITKALKKHFDVELDAVASAKAATDAVQHRQYDLILVNRLFDANGESGIDWIRMLKPSLQSPIMLISNYPEAHAEAIAAGAVQGFGKKMVGKPELVAVVDPYLK